MLASQSSLQRVAESIRASPLQPQQLFVRNAKRWSETSNHHIRAPILTKREPVHAIAERDADTQIATEPRGGGGLAETSCATEARHVRSTNNANDCALSARFGH
eukprot:2568245-Prymnesium_polylepis.1